MFGSYLINDRKKTKAKLSLRFTNGELNIYTAHVKLLEDKPGVIYDWSTDVMNRNWNPAKAKKKLKELPDMLVCDALLDQELFAGVGNIIKNEVLFRIKVHPESMVGALPVKQLNALVKEARLYSFDFLEWKKKGELKKHWQAYSRKICPRCSIKLHKSNTGKSERRSFYCNNCQMLYT